jgi:hypothetical protein
LEKQRAEKTGYFVPFSFPPTHLFWHCTNPCAAYPACLHRLHVRALWAVRFTMQTMPEKSPRHIGWSLHWQECSKLPDYVGSHEAFCAGKITSEWLMRQIAASSSGAACRYWSKERACPVT